MFLANNANGARVRRPGHQALTESRMMQRNYICRDPRGATSAPRAPVAGRDGAARDEHDDGGHGGCDAQGLLPRPRTGEARPPRPGRDAGGLQRATGAEGAAQGRRRARSRRRISQTVKWPADGKLLGRLEERREDRAGRPRQQYCDDPKGPVGGNCYACHQLTKEEISYGTIGPSLYQFGKMRGYGPRTCRSTPTARSTTRRPTRRAPTCRASATTAS